MNKNNIDKEGNEYCFSYLPDGEGGFKIVKLYKNVKGYGELGYKHFSKKSEIATEVKKMNEELLGLNIHQVQQIELSVL